VTEAVAWLDLAGLPAAACTVSAALVGLLAYDWIMDNLFAPVTVAAALMVGGILILVVEAS
jgi:undecaprenyl pyrophosphate phosphatase UppP